MTAEECRIIAARLDDLEAQLAHVAERVSRLGTRALDTVPS